MFDHVKFGVTDYAASKAFFLEALAPLGVTVASEGSPEYGVELSTARGTVSLCLFQSDDKPAPLHLAFAAENRAQVDAFHRAALKAGAADNGAPGVRSQYNANYYAAFVIGPDGHNMEAVCQAPEVAPMADQNKLILQKANAEISRKNIEGFLQFCTDDIVWTTVGGDTLRGKQALRQWMAKNYVEPPEFTVDELIGEGDFLVAVGSITVKDASGAPVPHAYSDVWRFREGRMAELKAFVIEV